MKRAAILVTLIAISIFPSIARAAPQERTTTVADRSLVNLTVYNGGTALIHDRRRIRLDAGFNRIAWRDVSQIMDPTSALLRVIGSTNRVDMLEQNFNFDLLDPNALLQKYVGRTVTIVHPARFSGERDTQEQARILSINNGIVLQYRDRIETDMRGYIVYPASPENFRDRPTLDLDIQSARSGSDTLDLSYLTGGLAWRADYVGLLSADEKRLDLTGIVTLSNTSGASYEDARLQLVAGSVNIANPPGLGRALNQIAAGTTSDVFSVNAASQENYFEYHLYTFARTTTILDKQTKQLSLLSAHGVPVNKTLELRGDSSYYRSAEPDLGDRLPVGVYVAFQNKGGDLGIPLPAGIVRIYQNDSRGLSQFLGSESIVHTPRNEQVRLHLGDSFDVTARKRQTDFHQLGSCADESSYEVRIANAKDEEQTVLVVEPLPGTWRITQESSPHVKSSSTSATWTVPVPADGSATLTYTARTSWC